MKGSIALIIAITVEIILLFLIFLVLLVGILGVFLPILPGILFIGFAMGLYSLMVQKNYGAVTPKLHKYVVLNKEKILNFKIVKNYMRIINKIKKRRQARIEEEILKNGLILFGFNIALVAAFLFGFVGISYLAILLGVDGLLLAFVPLVIIFIFAASSAVVWYRFGGVLSRVFKKRKILNSALVVFVSILPMLGLVLFLSAIAGLVGIFSDYFMAVTFLGILLMTVLASVFELLIVSFGIITSND